MEPDSAIRLRRQTAGRTYPDRRSRQPEELGRNLAQTQQDRKDTDGETSTQYGPCPQQYTKKDGSQNTLFGLLFEGNQNCCLTETAPQAAAPVPPVSKPEPEVHRTADIFEDDQELKEQARLARLKKEEEEREAKLAAKEAENFASKRKRKRKKDGKEKPVRAGFSARSTR